MTTQELLQNAKAAKGRMALADTRTKNQALLAMADALEAHSADILAANALDLEAAKGTVSEVMLDRLALSSDRIAGMAAGLREVAELPDPVGAVLRRVEPPQRHLRRRRPGPEGGLRLRPAGRQGGSPLRRRHCGRVEGGSVRRRTAP